MIARLLPLLLALLLGSDSATRLLAWPALWVVRDADTTIYLFGTVHMLRPGTDWFRGRVREAFGRSDALVTEVVLPPSAEFQAIVREMGSGTIDPADRPALGQALASIGLPADTLDGEKPWLAATQLSVLPLVNAGYSDEIGADQMLDDAARRAGKPHLALETVRGQFAAFDGLSQPAQRRLLANAIRDVGHAPAAMDATVAAWARGDTGALARATERELAGAPELEQALLRNRNAGFANWITARMRRPGILFVAIGAGHLAGPDSLQTMLAARGLKAVPVASQ